MVNKNSIENIPLNILEAPPNVEIEKKFLVESEIWKSLVYDTQTIYQGYFIDKDKKNKRIRIISEISKAIIAYKEDKGIINGFLERIEEEKEIDYQDGLLCLIRCDKVLVKKRNYIKHHGLVIEIDEFLNLGISLTVAEIEVNAKQALENLNLPEWLDRDISLSKNYRNSALVKMAQNSDTYLKSLLKL